MSHIVTRRTQKGSPEITNLKAVHMAAENLGLKVREDTVFRYWGGATHSGSVLVLSKPGRNHEIGIMPDKNNAGCFTIAADGMSDLNDIVGEPCYEGGEEVVCPELLMHIQMSTVALKAREQGDAIEWQQLNDGSHVAVVTQAAYA